MVKKEIGKIWASGKAACLVIPKQLASDYKLSDNDHVTIEGTEQGILIKKLDI